MNNNDNLPIYQNGITLSPEEERVLVQAAWSQQQKIAKILQNRSPHGFTVAEMIEVLKNLPDGDAFHDRSVQRTMSTLTGTKSAPESLKDPNGQFPLLKLTEKRLDPKTQVQVHVYAWNPSYIPPKDRGKKNNSISQSKKKKTMSHAEILAKHRNNQQMNFHPELERYAKMRN